MSRVSILDAIETNLTPYTVTYSPEGNYLAYGEGFYYGSGNIVVFEPGGKTIARLNNLENQSDTETIQYSVSGLCFDQSSNYLAASLWGASHWYYPAKLFKLTQDKIVEEFSFEDDYSDLDQHDLEYRGYATGIALVDNKVIVRRSCCPEHTLTSYELDKSVQARTLQIHLSSARLAVLKNAVATGCHRPRVLTQEVFGKPVKIVTFGDGRESISSNLLIKWLDSQDDYQIIGMPHVVSAICANSDGSKLVSGGADGSISFWSYNNPMNLKLIDESILRQTKLEPACDDDKCKTQPSPTYNGNSIVAICFLDQENFLVTAEASGHIKVWKEEKLIASFQTEHGSPRSLAAQPGSWNIAIAAKGNKDGKVSRGSIKIYDLESIL